MQAYVLWSWNLFKLKNTHSIFCYYSICVSNIWNPIAVESDFYPYCFIGGVEKGLGSLTTNSFSVENISEVVITVL